MKKLFFFLWMLFSLSQLQAQTTGIVRGTVKDKNTQEPLIGVAIIAEGTQTGTATDTEGNFKLVIPTGSYNLKATLVGYQALVKYNVVVTSGNANILSFEMEEDVSTLGEVEIVGSRTVSPTTYETPLSVQRLTTEEIKSNPGGNFDISRVIQSLPGVGGTAGSVGGFRNDIIIRGGAPNENVFYLDGIEIPVINHFSTQGSAGGPVGMLNVSFIEDVKLSSSAFEARYDNALASVFQFRQREGNPERVQGNLRLSSTELAATLEGAAGKKTTFLASARRSYLQFLFQAIDLPIRPNYWDFQYKVTHKLNAKTTITALGVGAIDEFSFAVPKKSDVDKEYILRSQPSINQWNYTVGFSLKRLLNNGYLNIALSRNMFDNNLDRFENKIEDEAYRILRVRSQEIENKLRIDVNKTRGRWKYAYGLMGQYVKFNNSVFNRILKEVKDDNGNIIQPGVSINFNTAIDFFRFGGFAQASRSFFKDRLGLSAGIRTDMNNFTTEGTNPLRTLSPRLSASYILTDKWNINASVGRYYKLPVYTVLGFRDSESRFVNKNNKYIESTHYVAGLEYLPKNDLRFTLEGFYKNYDNYPVSVRNGISLANEGGNFGAIGNEQVQSTGKGRAYGFEFFMQQKLTGNIFAVFSYTFVRSEFSGADGKFVSSAWDNRHLISALFGKKFKRGWELGLKYRFAGGAPYTPFDMVASQRNYATLGTGLLDYPRLNSERLRAFQQFDFRIDKKINFKRLTLDLYLDVTNALLFNNPAYPLYTFKRTADNSNFETSDGQPLRSDGQNGIPLILKNESALVTPTLGFIVEF